jgi:hypothetical protein
MQLLITTNNRLTHNLLILAIHLLVILLIIGLTQQILVPCLLNNIILQINIIIVYSLQDLLIKIHLPILLLQNNNFDVTQKRIFAEIFVHIFLIHYKLLYRVIAPVKILRYSRSNL